MSADIREFPNEYPDYQVGSSFVPFDVENRQISQEWKAKLWENIECELKHLEKGLERGVDWHDSSVYTGTAGVALLYFHLSSVDKSNERAHLTKALSYIEPVIGALKGRRLSFLCGDPGPLALGAVLYHKLDKQEKSEALLHRLSKLHKSVVDLDSDLPDELLYGRTGYLYSLLFVRKYISEDCIELAIIKLVLNAILKSGQKLSSRQRSKYPLMYEWHNKCYLGAAHGLCGILYMLLQVSELMSSNERNDLVKTTIDKMMDLRYPSGNYPSSMGNNSDKLIHWCHGAPGFIHMYAMAFKIFKEEKYLDEALSCGEVIWKRGLLQKGYGICHGVSGNAFAFLLLYRLTGDLKHLYRATKFAEWCFSKDKRECRRPDRPWSLFEGLAGVVFFFTSMLEPSSASFPAFQLW